MGCNIVLEDQYLAFEYHCLVFEVHCFVLEYHDLAFECHCPAFRGVNAHLTDVVRLVPKIFSDLTTWSPCGRCRVSVQIE